MPRKRQPAVPERRPYGSWAIDHIPGRAKPWRVRPPRSVDPKRTPTYHLTRVAAEAWIGQQIARAALPAVPTLTLGDWAEHWLTQSAISSDWAANTVSIYTGHLGHLEPLYGANVGDVTRGQIQDRIAALLTAGPRVYRRENGEPYTRPLSALSVNEIAGTWRRLFADALEDGLIAANPARKLRLPKVVRVESPTWSPAEARRLVAVTRGHRFEVVVSLIVGCALRIGEVLALAYDDIDHAGQTALIRRSGSKKLVQEHTKSRRVRTISLPSPVWAALLRHREQQFAGAEYVLEREPGRRWTYHTVRRVLRELTTEAGIPDYAFHAGRRSTSSYLLASGASVAEVSRLLGHSSPAVTMDRYAIATESPEHVAGLAEGLFSDE